LTVAPGSGPAFLADPRWPEGRVVRGYVFTGVFGAEKSKFTATPEIPGKTGFQIFTIDETGVITATP